MPRKFIQRYMPNPASLREHPVLRPLGNLLHDPGIWHLHKRSVSGACFIGCFCAFLPIPFQMIPAALLAIASRCNLPIAVALVWISNPLTIGPLFYFAYRLGAWLLNTEPTIHAVELNVEWLTIQLHHIWKPLLLGSITCGWVAGVSASVLSRLLWRFHVIRRWKARRAKRKSAS
ncbi:MAG: DUF2062 domain-containing protein [Pseudomonadales bacterium]|nr:DUF2062 domain-containing protein [Pseudomonadales bacterium]